ncbi:pentatricopeptide repeat-containing protein At5g61800-like [Ananas comosus]|uniref:Pentatricopeptide repeat-containing protein At5g61800-like n=1 Tax=Ananas comosus TaxID=4615 RepID=A0A6P5GV86_ANACO|nr:pentatricopeptide repeat-containing protein At5g61800-like [Ananas comosus]
MQGVPKNVPHNLTHHHHHAAAVNGGAAANPFDPGAFPSLLSAAAAARRLPLGRALHALTLTLGLLPSRRSPLLSNALLAVYAACAAAPDARRAFDEAGARDLVSYNTLLAAYSRAGLAARARALFDEMPRRDPVSWGTLISCYARRGLPREGLALLRRMLATRTPPDDVALASALSCCAQSGALDQGKMIHRYVERHRGSPNVYVATGLVDMYAKCGCIGEATRVFEWSPHRNVYTWNALIGGLAMHGHVDTSLAYFARMRRSGVRPDGVTLLALLTGCSHAGRVDTAKRLFGEMESVHGVARELKHYGCMADLLSRAGLIAEAAEMIERMPTRGDAYVWGGLLAGCRIHHGNVGVAEAAAERLLELDPEDSGVYSIMAEIYAAEKRWKDVRRMRRLMERVRRDAGRSSIEVDRNGLVSMDDDG